MTQDIAWIAADWGTTNLRVWAMSAGNVIIATAQSDQGMGKLTPDAFEGALLDLVGDWLTQPTPVIACGMVGARQGWVEADYLPVPAEPLGGTMTQAPTQHPHLDVHIIPGMMQSQPADVMRGEETQIAGFLTRNKNWDGVICLPGTHTKWVHISADEVVSFQTIMTGDLFAAISGHTVLRHSVDAGWDNDAFAAGVDEAMARPEKIAGRLFNLRAEGLLNGMTNATARARLSGLLIGAELAATKPYWLGQQVAVIGQGNLAKLYIDALASVAVPATQVQNDAVTLAGLTAAYRRLKE